MQVKTAVLRQMNVSRPYATNEPLGIGEIELSPAVQAKSSSASLPPASAIPISPSSTATGPIRCRWH